MAKRGKKYQEAFKKIEQDKRYSLLEGTTLVKEISYASYDATVTMAVNLGINAKRDDQRVRGAVPLPAGLGKNVRVLCFAKGEKIQEAEAAGADFVGGDEYIAKIKDEAWLGFDKVVASPDMMGLVGRVARILGTRGLMPNPKLGTVTFDVGQAVKTLKAGKAEFRAEKSGICHIVVGKASFEPEQLVLNIQAVIEALQRSKPQASKGRYFVNATLSSSASPGIPLDLSEFA